MEKPGACLSTPKTDKLNVHVQYNFKGQFQHKTGLNLADVLQHFCYGNEN